MRIPQIPLFASFPEYGSLGSMLSVTADERLTITTQRMLRDGQHCTAIAPLAALINADRTVGWKLATSVIAPVARNSCPIH
jgi:hypothetical protein